MLLGNTVKACRHGCTLSKKGGTFMICVGIDAASEKHDVCITNQEGETFKRVFTIHNNKTEYKKLLNEIESAKKFWNDSKVCIGIESTGVYSETLVNYLSNFEDFEVIYINPILTNMFVHSETVHYAKTDKADAQSICNFLSDKRKRLYTYTQPSYTILEMKSLGREVNHLDKQLNKLTNRLTGLLHIVFPEFFQIFDKVKGTTCLEYLRIYPTPNLIRKKRTLNDVYNYLDKRGRKISNFDNLINLAKETVGKFTKSDEIIISSLASQLQLLNKQKEELVNRMKQLCLENARDLLTIPGAGYITCCTIIGEIGNISNFHGADSLVAFIGINPLVYQSGKYDPKGLSISKKGSSYLRNAIIQISRLIVQYDESFKQYFEKKLAEGKHYNVAIGHVSNKLIRVIYHILKYKEPYKNQL